MRRVFVLIPILIALLAQPAHAALVFPLRDFEIRVERRTAISRAYVRGQPYYTPANYHWKGEPIGLLVINGHTIQPGVRKRGKVLNRCKFQVAHVDGQQWIGIGRGLAHWPHLAVVEAGPCIQRSNGRLQIFWQEEGFEPWFALKKAWRNVICTDRPVTRVVVFRYYGPLSVALIDSKMQAYGMQTCLNMDGGSTVISGFGVVTIGFYPR